MQKPSTTRHHLGSTRKQMVSLAIIGMSCLCVSGCFGTIVTRTSAGSPQADVIGSYPYAAVVVDCRLASFTSGHREGDFTGPIPLISIPFDLVIDTIMLPLDVIAWPCGWKKYTM